LDAQIFSPSFVVLEKFGSLFPNPQMTWNWTKVWQTFWLNSKRFLNLPSLHSKTEFIFNLWTCQDVDSSRMLQSSDKII
jgi:hypothetical protein